MPVQIIEDRLARIDGRATSLSVSVRFWSWVDCGENGCWEWQGRRDEKGYGRTSIGGRKNRGAHRVAWELTYGPTDLHVLHRCDNPPCCNPAHLFLGTNRDNAIDRHRKGRSKNVFAADSTHPARIRAGELHWCAKLSTADVQAIRTLHANGHSQAELGARFNVHPSTISRIVRRAWRKEVA